MRDDDWLAAEFETSRPRLHAVAYRMLGSHADADDAVQEAWLCLAGGDHDRIENTAGLLTTVVGRVCLDRLRARRSRPEEPIEASGRASAKLSTRSCAPRTGATSTRSCACSIPR